MSAGSLNVAFEVVREPYEVLFIEADGVRLIASPEDITKFSHLHRAAMLGMDRPAGASVWFTKESKVRDVEMVTIRVPGQVDFSTRPVTDYDRKEFAAEYEAWKAGRRHGTPLAALSEAEAKEIELNPGMVKELTAAGCDTLEHLAGLQDGVIRGLMGGVALRRRAQAVLDRRKAQVIPPPVQAVLDALTARVAALEARINQGA